MNVHMGSAPFQADEAQMRQFFNAIFKRCGNVRGYVALRAFEHEREGVAVVNQWAPFDRDTVPTAARIATEVAQLRGKKRAVFAPPVAIFGEGRNKDGARFGGETNIVCAPAITAELDERPQESLDALRDVLGEPTLVVASGGVWNGQPKLHAYWRLGEPATTDEAKATLKTARKMATRLVGADGSAVALSHPMRWPGSWHTKGEPRMCEIVGGDPDREIKLQWAVEALDDALLARGLEVDGRGALARAERKGFSTPREWPAEDLHQAADAIPNADVGWNEWNNTGMAFYDASHGSADGLEAFIRWSEKSHKGNADDAERRWKHYASSPPSELSGHKLIALARDNAPELATRKLVEMFRDDAAIEAARLYEEAKAAGETAAGEKAPGLFEVLTIDQLFNLPDPEFLIDRHVPEKSVGFLYGDPGTGKSFIALDWALHVAFDRPDWFGDPVQHKPDGCVIYIAGEGASGFKTRIAAWLHRRGVTDPSGRFGLIQQSVNFMSGDDVKRLLATLRQVVRSPVSMIVIDTVSRAMPGADENLQKEMTLFVKACDVVRDAFGCAVLGVHHAGKSGDMRGSTVLRGAGDYVFKLERKRGASVGRLHCEKQKDAPDGWSDAYRFDVVTLGSDRSSLVPERVLEGATAGEVELTPDLARAVLEAMQADWHEGEPWGRAHQSGERWAARKMVRGFGFDLRQAENVLAVWIGSGAVVEDVSSRKSKRKGLRVADISSAAGAEIEGETEGDVFD